MRLSLQIHRFIVVLAAAAVAATASSDLQADTYSTRFGGPHRDIMRNRTVSQAVVSVQNAGDKARRLRAGVLTTDSQKRDLICYGSAMVQAGTVRKISFLVSRDIIKVLASKDAGKKKSTRKSGEQTMVLWDANTGQQLKKTPFRASMIDDDASVICRVYDITEKNETDKYLINADTSPFGKARAAAIRSEAAPTRWYGHDITHVLILKGMNVSDYSPSQIQAMLDWVRRGGFMIIAGSVNMPEILTGPIAQAAGVCAVETHRIKHIKVKDASGKSAGSANLPHPLTMAELCVDSAEVLYTANALPLLTRKAFGLGQVLTLSVSLGALDAKLPVKKKGDKPVLVFRSLWKTIADARKWQRPLNADVFLKIPTKKTIRFAQTGKTRVVRNKANRTAAKPKKQPKLTERNSLAMVALQEIAGKQAPRSIVPVGIVVILAGTFGVLWLALARKKRSELAWLLLIPASIAATVGLGIYGRTHTEPEKLSYVGLLYGLDGENARLQAACVYRPGKIARSRQLAAGSGRGLVREISQPGSAKMESGKLETASQVLLPKGEMLAGSSHAFVIDDVIPSKGISGSVSFDNTGVVGRLTNHLDGDLLDVAIYANERVFPIGTIRSGATFDLAGHANRVNKEGDFTAQSAFKSERARLRNDTLVGLATQTGRRRLVSAPVLIAYMETIPVDTVPGANAASNGWTQVVWPLNVVSPETPGKMLVPAGWTRLASRNTRGKMSTMSFAMQLKGIQKRRLRMIAISPAPLGKLQQVKLNVMLNIRAPGRKVTVYGVTEAGKTAKVETVKSPDGVLNIEIPNADRFFSRIGGGYCFDVLVERDRAVGLKKPETATSINWNIRRIEVSLEGISR